MNGLDNFLLFLALRVFLCQRNLCLRLYFSQYVNYLKNVGMSTEAWTVLNLLLNLLCNASQSFVIKEGEDEYVVHISGGKRLSGIT